jgi:glucose uptake protein
MFIVENYQLAVLLCIITMICWGSWANTQKLASKTWRFELFYWDYVIGILLFSVIIGFTLGSFGDSGRSFLPDMLQAGKSSVISALIGGVVFNAANILLSASISLAGMAVAFPLGVGIALVLGVFVNYFNAPKGDPVLLFLGVALVMLAVIFNGIASGKIKKDDAASIKTNKKGVLLAIVAGILMAFFYRFVAASMDLDNFESPAAGMLTPYSAFFIFSVGIFISNILFNTVVMKKPFEGKPVMYSDYFKGKFSTHLVGILGGIIWALGTSLSYIAAGKAGAAISYALGQGAPMIAALWGVFVWKEFKGSSKIVNLLLLLMFVLFIAGLMLIVVSGGN